MSGEALAVMVLSGTLLIVMTGLLAWVLVRERCEVAAAWRLNRELVARLQSRDPNEFAAWRYEQTRVEPPPRDEYIFDETGLLRVPREDRGED